MNECKEKRKKSSCPLRCISRQDLKKPRTLLMHLIHDSNEKKKKKGLFSYLASRPSWGYRLVNSYDHISWPTLLSLYWWPFHPCSWSSKSKNLPLWIFDWWWSNRHSLYDDTPRLLCSWAECWLQRHWKKRRLRSSLFVKEAVGRWTFVLHEWTLLDRYLDQ